MPASRRSRTIRSMPPSRRSSAWPSAARCAGWTSRTRPTSSRCGIRTGIGWIPYILWRMDAEWEDQFKDLSLTMPPSEYWKRQCWATYQTDPIGIKLIDELGVDKIMWGSDFPHPDGVWPDSREYVQRELGHLPADVRRKIVCENAARLYGFELGERSR